MPAIDIMMVVNVPHVAIPLFVATAITDIAAITDIPAIHHAHLAMIAAAIIRHLLNDRRTTRLGRPHAGVPGHATADHHQRTEHLDHPHGKLLHSCMDQADARRFNVAGYLPDS